MSNKTVFITGASSGLGKQMAREFASKGYSLGLAARRLEKLQELKDELSKTPDIKVAVYALDVANTEAVFDTIKQAKEELGQLDIVIANAGVGYSSKIGKSAFEKPKNIIDINVTGAMATIDAAVRVFRQQGFGQVVGISSLAAALRLPGLSAYSASKAALLTYMNALRVETVKDNIDITILKPGYIDTPMNEDVANRPFVISLEKGAKLLVKEILNKTKETHVPRMPWNILGPIMAKMPVSVMSRFG